jgi:hypothetical protein
MGQKIGIVMRGMVVIDNGVELERINMPQRTMLYFVARNILAPIPVLVLCITMIVIIIGKCEVLSTAPRRIYEKNN